MHCTVLLDKAYFETPYLEARSLSVSGQFINAGLNILTECFLPVYHARRIADTSSSLGSASGQSQSSSVSDQLSHQHCHLLIQGKMPFFESHLIKII